MKNRRAKKVLSIILALVIVLSALPLTPVTSYALTSGDYEYEIISETEKTAKITGYVGDDAELTIPAELNGYTITTIEYNAFYKNTTLNSVVIPDSVTAINFSAFLNCSNLSSVTLGSSVASIGYAAFGYCTALKEITIFENVTSIDNNAFMNSGLTTIYGHGGSRAETFANENGYTFVDSSLFLYEIISEEDKTIEIVRYLGNDSNVVFPNKIDGYKVTSIDCVGYTVKSAKSVTILADITFCRGFYNWPNLTEIKVESNSYTYYSDDGILYRNYIDGHPMLECYPAGRMEKSFEIPSWVELISRNAFSGCKHLEEIRIPNTVSWIGESAFSGCISLKKINIPDGISEIPYRTFTNCSSLTNVTIPNSVTSIGYGAFDGCTSLTDIKIPNSVTTIENDAFYGCTKLTSIEIPESVTSISENAFTNSGLTTIYGKMGSYAETYANENGYYFVDTSVFDFKVISEDDKTIKITGYTGTATNIAIPAKIGEYTVTTIGFNAFYNNSTLETVVIPDTVTTVEFVAFLNCENLSIVTLGESVTSIGYAAFGYCPKLTSIHLPQSVTSLDEDAFLNSGLENISGGTIAKDYADKNGIEFFDTIIGITATPITLIENGDGYFSWDYNGNYYFHYDDTDLRNKAKYTILYGSGKTEVVTYWEIEEITGNTLEFTRYQNEEPYKLGTNKIPIECGDITGFVEIVIVENPVVSIKIKDVSFVEGTNGYVDTEYDEYGNEIGEYYRYSYTSDLNFVATLKDGTTVESKAGSILLHGKNYYLDISDDQSTNHWSAGDYTVTGSLFGISDEFTVSITESPIASIVCEDIEIIEHTNGYYTTGYNPETDDWDLEYFNYYTPLKCTITMKNGDVIECDDEWFEYNGESYYIQIDDNQYNSPWVLGGTYTLSFWLMGVYAEYDVTIIETDIQTMTVTPSRPLYEGLDSKNGIYVYSNSLDYSLNIVYKDGTTEVVTYTARDLMDSNSLRFNDTQLENPWGIGTNTVTASYRGYTTEFEIQVLENPFESLTISSEDGLTLYFNKKEGGVVEAHPYDLDARRGEFGCAIGMLFTDIGNFETYIYFKTDETSGESYNNKNVRIVIGDMESNTLDENNWYKVRVDSETLLFSAAFFRMNGYNGEITAENIDDVISTTMCFYDMYNNSLGSVIIEDLFYYIFNADEIIAVVKNLFGVEFDITMSELYDIETNTIKVKEFSGGDAIPIFDVSYSNNTWTAIKSYNYEGMRTFKVEWTDDLTVKSINWCEMKLDANSDGEIDYSDYEKIISAVTLGSTLTDSEALAADANGDGTVDAFDVIYIDLYLNGMLN